jgi:hypothetical protein
MNHLKTELGTGAWGLSRARAVARQIEGSASTVRQLVTILFGEDIERRKRAADTARRITERDPTPLEPHADELAGLLAVLSLDEQRTRWHLGLVVPRVAATHDQRLRAARLMLLLTHPEGNGNVVRCSGIEGIALLATREPSCATWPPRSSSAPSRPAPKPSAAGPAQPQNC